MTKDEALAALKAAQAAFELAMARKKGADADATAAEMAIKRARSDLWRLVRPVKTYSIAPSGGGMGRLWDPDVLWCSLVGTPLNVEDLRMAGRTEDELRPQGMSLLVNRRTRHVVETGGGWSQFPDGTFSFQRADLAGLRAEAQRVYDALASFVADNPEGGDVTEIVRSHRFLGKEDA